MTKQHGFTLSEFVLACVIASLVLAMTAPALLRWVEGSQQHNQLNRAVNDTLRGMEMALTTHWQTTQCRTSPSLLLADLINDYGVPSSVTQTWPLTVHFTNDTVTPYISRSVSVIVTAPTDAQAMSSPQWLDNKEGWVQVNGRIVTITRPVTAINSVMEQANFNPTTGCMEQ